MKAILELSGFVEEGAEALMVKTIVFGLKQREGKVYTQVIKNCSKKVIIPLINQRISTTSVVYTDGFKTYDGLVDMGYKKHYRVHHGKK